MFERCVFSVLWGMYWCHDSCTLVLLGVMSFGSFLCSVLGGARSVALRVDIASKRAGSCRSLSAQGKAATTLCVLGMYRLVELGVLSLYRIFVQTLIPSAHRGVRCFSSLFE